MKANVNAHLQITALKIVMTRNQTNWIMFKEISVWFYPRSDTIVQQEDATLAQLRALQAEWVANQGKDPVAIVQHAADGVPVA